MGLLRRLRDTLNSHRIDTALDEEMRFHIEQRTDEYVRSGMPVERARREALRRFGSVARTREQSRDVNTLRWLADIRNDVWYAFRVLKQSPLFAAATVATLALGIGANTAIFSLWDALLLRQLAVHQPRQLVQISSSESGGPRGPLLKSMVDLIRSDGAVDGVCGFLTLSVSVEIHGHTAPVQTHPFTGDCFQTLGIQAAVGRLTTPDDDLPGSPHVVVLSFDAWQADYGGQASALGQSVNIDGVSYRIVGVAEAGFKGLIVGYPAKLFLPLANLEGGLATYLPRGDLMPMDLLARLPAGATQETVTARVLARWPDWLRQTVPARMPPGPRAGYLKRDVHVLDASTGVDRNLRQRFGTPLGALLAISGLVLLAACVNTANLLLARGAARRRDTAVRIALGASRGRLLREAAVEGLILLSGGIAGGLLVAYWVAHGLVLLFGSAASDFFLDMRPDARVLAFTSVIATLSFLVFAIIPAWRGTRIDVNLVTTAASRVVGGHARLRQSAIVAQVAITVILVTLGATFMGSLQGLRTVPLGFTAEDLVGAQLSALPGGYQVGFSGGSYYRALLERVESVPGIASAALAHDMLLQDLSGLARVSVAGSDTEVSMSQAFVSDGFFETLGIPLMAGQAFSRADSPSSVRAAIVSESAALALFGHEPAVGRVIRVGVNPVNQALRVIGVARDAVMSRPQARRTQVVYLNFWQFGLPIQSYSTLLVRGVGGRPYRAESLDSAVREGGHEYISRVRTVAEQRDAALAEEQLLSTLSTAFAALGLSLAGIGLFGLLSFIVTERTSELGIRMALGASRWQMGGLICAHGSMLVATGLAVGGPSAWLAGNAAIAALGGSETEMSFPILVAGLLTVAVSAISIWMPVRRATRVEPLLAIRRD